MSARLDLPPPPALEEERGGDGGWVQLSRAANDIDAHLLSGRLEEAGIETRWVKDRGQPGAWLYGGSNPWAPVAIFVRRVQLLDARVVLAEVAFELPAAEAPRSAPEHRGWHRPLIWWIAAVLLGVGFTGLWLYESARTLGRCHPVVCDAP